MSKRHFLLCLMLASLSASAQNDGLVISGSIQSDILIPEEDKKIGATTDSDWGKTNTYVDLQAQSKYVDAGLRLEYLEHPLPGYEAEIKGWGVPHFYLKGKGKNVELTIGTFYEQFGSGFILRSYEERSLGIDNSLLGARVVTTPIDGVRLKGLYGKQRTYWDWADNYIGGADLELSVDQWVKAMQQSNTRLTLGASWVNKEEQDERIDVDATHRLNLPRFVNAWDVRANLHVGHWGVLAEYARKSEDPSYENGYTYRNGSAAMLSASYSKKGLSVLLQAKRSEDMSFRSQRSRTGTAAFVNHLPSFTQEQTYTLAALYPYATQLADGEWAYQGELAYNFKRKTALGGKYGMDVKLNFSYVRGIKRDFLNGGDYNSLSGNPVLAGTDGYTTSFFGWGDHTYYQDLNVQLSRKFTKAFKLNLMYMNQRYNQAQVEGHGEMIHSNIFIADGKYQFSPKTTLRAEAQYLTTKQDEGDWAFGLLELSLVPHWMITVSDEWNCGETDIHYYQALVTYNTGAHRIQAGYGRVADGYNCSGGVCRYVPASKGFTLSYNYNF